jgi:hypothetical protein
MHAYSKRSLSWVVGAGVLGGVLWLSAGGSARAAGFGNLSGIDREVSHLLTGVNQQKPQPQQQHATPHHNTQHHVQIKDPLRRVHTWERIEHIHRTEDIWRWYYGRDVVGPAYPHNSKPSTTPVSKPKS